MKEQKQRLNDVFPDALSGSGIFNALQEFDVPWQVENISASLDLEYHGNISGDKYISPLIRRVKENYALSDTEIEKLAGVIYNMYNVNWKKQWDTLFLEFNPIENYSMVEKMIDDTTVTNYGRTDTKTNNLTHSKTGTETQTPNLDTKKTGTETTSPNLTNSGSNSRYGFNSSNAVPADASTNTTTGTDTVTYNTNVKNSGTDTLTHNTQDRDTGTQTDALSGSDSNVHNYTLTRAGNIGVTTSQQMIESSRSLYMWNFFYTVVFPDIDRVLTLSIY